MIPSLGEGGMRLTAEMTAREENRGCWRLETNFTDM